MAIRMNIKKTLTPALSRSTGRGSKRTSARIAVWLLLLVAAGQQSKTFEYRAGPTSKPSNVSVAGTFNNWSMTANPMVDRGGGVWTTTVTLPEGIYQYKFVVNGTDWKTD